MSKLQLRSVAVYADMFDGGYQHLPRSALAKLKEVLTDLSSSVSEKKPVNGERILFGDASVGIVEAQFDANAADVVGRRGLVFCVGACISVHEESDPATLDSDIDSIARRPLTLLLEEVRDARRNARDRAEMSRLCGASITKASAAIRAASSDEIRSGAGVPVTTSATRLIATDAIGLKLNEIEDSLVQIKQSMRSIRLGVYVVCASGCIVFLLELARWFTGR
jgi:hypothetical protein